MKIPPTKKTKMTTTSASASTHTPPSNQIIAELDAYILSLSASHALSPLGQYIGTSLLTTLCHDTINDESLLGWLYVGNGNRWLKGGVMKRLREMLEDIDTDLNLEVRLRWCVERGRLEELVRYRGHEERLLKREVIAEILGGYKKEERKQRWREEMLQYERMEVDREDTTDKTIARIFSPALSPKSLPNDTETIRRENNIPTASSSALEFPKVPDDVLIPKYVSEIPNLSLSSAESPESLDHILFSDDDSRSSSGSVLVEKQSPVTRTPTSPSGSRKFPHDISSDNKACHPNTSITPTRIRESAKTPTQIHRHPQDTTSLDSYIRSIVASLCLDNNGQFIGSENLLTHCVSFVPSSPGHRVFLPDRKTYTKPEVIARMTYLLTSAGLTEEVEVLALANDWKALDAMISIPGHRDNVKCQPKLVMANSPAPQQEEVENLDEEDESGMLTEDSLPESWQKLGSEEGEELDQEEEFGMLTELFLRHASSIFHKDTPRDEMIKLIFIRSLCASLCMDDFGNFVGRRKLLTLCSYALPEKLDQMQAVGYGLAFHKSEIIRRIDDMLKYEGLDNDLVWHMENGRLMELTPILSHRARLEKAMDRIANLRLHEGYEVPEMDSAAMEAMEEMEYNAAEMSEEMESEPLQEFTDDDDMVESASYYDADSEFDVSLTTYGDDSDHSDSEVDVDEGLSDFYQSYPGSVVVSEDEESVYARSDHDESEYTESEESESESGEFEPGESDESESDEEDSEEDETEEEESDDNESHHGIEFGTDWESSDSESSTDTESPDTSLSCSDLPAPFQPFLTSMQISHLHQLAPHFQPSLTPLQAAPAPSDRLAVLDDHLRSLTAAICLGPSGKYVGRNEILRLVSKFSPDISNVGEFLYSLAEVSARLISLLDDNNLGEALEWLIEQHRLEYFISHEHHLDMLRHSESRAAEGENKKRAASLPESNNTDDETYIPYDVQYQFIQQLQSALEHACFTWLHSNHPEFLEGNNWKVPEAANLEKYINIIHGPFLVAVPTKIKDAMLRIYNLAIHREPLDVKQIFGIIDSAASSCRFLARCGKFKGKMTSVDEKKVPLKKIKKLRLKLMTFTKRYKFDKERIKQCKETLKRRLDQVEMLRREILEAEKMEKEFNSWFKENLRS